MRNERVWPQQCWKSCANGSNSVALRFGDHGTKEMLGVVAPVLAVMWKRMQYLPTMLGPTGQREKDTTHKTFETMCNAHAWPPQCWKSCANGSNIDALRIGDHGTKEGRELLVQNFDRFQTLRNNTKQHPTRCANGRNDVRSCWPTILRPFARGFTDQFFGPASKVQCIKSRQKGHPAQKASCFSNVDVLFLYNVFFS